MNCNTLKSLNSQFWK